MPPNKVNHDHFGRNSRERVVDGGARLASLRTICRWCTKRNGDFHEVMEFNADFVDDFGLFAA
jgi:hypothetical protein